jgi:hypothetical protein
MEEQGLGPSSASCGGPEPGEGQEEGDVSCQAEAGGGRTIWRVGRRFSGQCWEQHRAVWRAWGSSRTCVGAMPGEALSVTQLDWSPYLTSLRPPVCRGAD